MTITTKEAERLAERLAHDAEAPQSARYQPYTDHAMRNAAAALRSLAAERDALKDALSDLLRCTEKHVFGDECKAQRDKARPLGGGATSATPPPIGSIWRSATGRVYVVVNNRMASAQAGWYVWVKNRSTPFRQKEWEAARMLHTGMV